MDAAQQALQGRSLYFLSHLSHDHDEDGGGDYGKDADASTTDASVTDNAQGQGQGQGKVQGNALPQGALLVPAAVYEFDPRLEKRSGLAKGPGLTQRQGKTNMGRMDRERLIGTAEVIASIMPGDVLLLPAFGDETEIPGGEGDVPGGRGNFESDINIHQLPSHIHREFPYDQQVDDTDNIDGDMGTTNVKTWHRVVSVDLFYARLKVTSCPPPPHCWLPHASLPSSWAPVSVLWASPVCRLLPPTSGGDLDTSSTSFPSSSSSSSTERQILQRLERYCVYLTPIPSIHAALGALQSLPSLSSHVSLTTSTRMTPSSTKARHTKPNRGIENKAPIIKKKSNTGRKSTITNKNNAI